MALSELLTGPQAAAALAALARSHGITDQQAATAIAAAASKLSAEIERNTLSRGGLADLVNALGHGHHEAYLDDARLVGDPTAEADGRAILGHIAGSKDRSRAIAETAAAASGVPSDIVRAMLPHVAGMVMGGLSKQVKHSLGDVLGRIGQSGEPAAGRGGVFLPKQPLPRASAPPSSAPGAEGGVRTNSAGGLEMPDNLPDYGRPDDGGPRRGRGGADGPLPLPGNRVPGMPGNGENPYGDLAEILRRGLGLPDGPGGPVLIPLPGGTPLPMPGDEQRAPRDTGGGFPWPQGGSRPRQQGGGGLPMPGGSRGIELPGGQVSGGLLWNLIRSILGGALGFQSKGVLSWIIRMVVMKYGWTILRTILGRGLGR